MGVRWSWAMPAWAHVLARLQRRCAHAPLCTAAPAVSDTLSTAPSRLPCSVRAEQHQAGPRAHRDGPPRPRLAAGTHPCCSVGTMLLGCCGCCSCSCRCTGGMPPCRSQHPLLPVPTSTQPQGDNFNTSTDSRHYGPVPYAMLRGRVFVKASPEGRRQKKRGPARRPCCDALPGSCLVAQHDCTCC